MRTFSPVELSASAITPGAFSRFFNYRIPLYQADIAASVLLFLVLYLFLHSYRITMKFLSCQLQILQRNCGCRSMQHFQQIF